jgi:oligoendopeptidase F
MALLDTSKTIWDLSPLFSGDEDPAMAVQRKQVEEKSLAFVNKWKADSSYITDPKKLKEALDDYEAWKREASTDGNEGYYFWLRSSQDENDPILKAKFNKVQEFAHGIFTQIQFFELQVSKIAPELQKKILEDESFAPYKHFLESLFAEARYLLSEEAEKIMVLKGTPAHERWVDMVSSFLSKEEAEIVSEDGSKKSKTFAEIMSFLDDQHKTVRDSAATALNAIFAKHADAAESEMNAILENKKVDDLLRGMPRPDFSRHLHDDIESSVVDALVETVASRFDISQRYYKFKARLLGVEKLAYHERNVSYGSFDVNYTYDQAVGLVYKVLNNLDPQFGSIFKNFVEGGHIDVFPRKGKSSGAFCAYNLLGQPVYMLLNYTGKLRDVTTIAHETGHGINDELMRLRQNSLNFGTPMATAEVASTFMEDFVLEELGKGLNDEQRLSSMMQKLNDDVSTIFRQIACYRFEQELHAQYREKGYLSKEAIGSLFSKHMKEYMGEGVSADPGSENWWIYWSHIRSFFYVYSYSSGLLISKAMQNKLRKDQNFITQVKAFLSAGESASPVDLFANMGIDIRDKNFWEQGLAETEKLLSDAEALALKLGKVAAKQISS